ncbi:MAG: adenylate/guanylate cyclase domain-containing protein [Candidatus Dormibacteraceae bacterium]
MPWLVRDWYPSMASLDLPEVQYARSGDLNIAFSVVGAGPFDIVFVSGSYLSNLDVAWEGTAADFYRSLASFARLIIFDKRGTGLSDRTVGIPDLETRMDDIRAVMDAAGSKRAAIVGVSEGGPMTILFAATYPERTAAAVLYGTLACFTRADDYPWGPTREERLELIRQRESRVGTPAWMQEALDLMAPDVSQDERVRRWWRKWCQTSASPGAIQALALMNTDIDVRHVLPAIRVPVLVPHRVADADTLLGEGRYIADKIPGAELVELPGGDHGWWSNPLQITAEIRRFVTGIWERGEWDVIESDRVLATVLFTDIVGSTAKLAELGDRGWRGLLEQHHAVVRRQLQRFSGREIDTAGDGFFASFDGPARAIRCATTIVSMVRDLGLEVRAGLHTGECEVVDGKVSGIAVHIGARVAAAAEPGEVLVSSTVRDLVAGSGIRFRDRGVVELKGLPGDWRLYLVEFGQTTSA